MSFIDEKRKKEINLKMNKKKIFQVIVNSSIPYIRIQHATPDIPDQFDLAEMAHTGDTTNALILNRQVNKTNLSRLEDCIQNEKYLTCPPEINGNSKIDLNSENDSDKLVSGLILVSLCNAFN